jgi:hypothetical protein
MKFYELPQATQDMLVGRQRDYVTSCMDWLEDLFPLINDRVNEEYGRIFTEPFDALMNIQEFEWPHNIVWSTTYTELDLAVFSEALGVFVPSYNARLELSPNGRVRLFFGEYQADSSWREFEDACTKIMTEVKDVILDIVSEYYEEATSTAYIESPLWDEDFKSNGDFAWEPPVLTDKELASHLFKTGTTETTTGNWIFDLADLDGRTPEQALDTLYAQGYQEYILDAEYTDDTLDIIFALDVCPNAD